MTKAIPLALLLAFTVGGRARAQRGRVPDISGTWYMNGDRGAPCEIVPLKRNADVALEETHAVRVGCVLQQPHLLAPRGRARRVRQLQDLLPVDDRLVEHLLEQRRHERQLLAGPPVAPLDLLEIETEKLGRRSVKLARELLELGALRFR